MKNSKYSTKLLTQANNVSKTAGIDFYLSKLYQTFQDACAEKERVLELGAGAGTSKKYLDSQNIVRTDLIICEEPGVQGNVDAQALPFKDESFDLIIGMDFIHHIQRPVLALREIERVLDRNSTGIQVVFIEPYISVASYLPYRIFHTEQTSLLKKRRLEEPLVGPMAEDGDQTIPRLLFCTKRGRDLVEEVFPSDDYEILISYISIWSFFVTGGINRPFPTPIWLVRLFLEIENKLSKKIMKFASSRMIIKIQKIDSKARAAGYNQRKSVER
jgi:SAM-dependent methyltransferase